MILIIIKSDGAASRAIDLVVLVVVGFLSDYSHGTEQGDQAMPCVVEAG